MAKKVLEIKGLKTYFHTEDGPIKALDGVDFYVNTGETLGIVGESGCGKSVASLSILRLVPHPQGVIEAGEVIFNKKKLLELSEIEMRNIRGNEISMIFQEPMTSLNPVFTIGYQLCEVLILHKGLSKEMAKKESIQLLKTVGIPRAEQAINDYPFSLSGGMRQRVMIAMAIACSPKLLIADEPTTALDVTIQAQVLALMKKLQKDYHTAIMFITHDLNVIAEIADRVVVMYAGVVVEEADVFDLFDEALHPYTKGLMKSRPDMSNFDEELHVIPGNVPNPYHKIMGCKFNDRCKQAMPICFEKDAPLIELTRERKVRCWLYDKWRE